LSFGQARDWLEEHISRRNVMLCWTKVCWVSVVLLLTASADVRSQEWTVKRGLEEWGFPDNPWTFRHGHVPLEPRLRWDCADTFLVPQAALAPKSKPGVGFLPGWFIAPDQSHLNPDLAKQVGAAWAKGDLVVHTTDPTNGSTNGEANAIWKSPVAGRVILSGKAWHVRSLGRNNQWVVSHITTGGKTTVNGKREINDETTREKPSKFFEGEGKFIEVAVGDLIELRIAKTSDVGDFVAVEFSIKAFEK
jgi:hypothetical protein